MSQTASTTSAKVCRVKAPRSVVAIGVSLSKGQTEERERLVALPPPLHHNPCGLPVEGILKLVRVRLIAAQCARRNELVFIVEKLFCEVVDVLSINETRWRLGRQHCVGTHSDCNGP